MKKLLLFLLTVLAVSLQSYAEEGTVAIVGDGYNYTGSATSKVTGDATTVTAPGICTMSFSNGVFHTGDKGWRIYANSTFTITPQTGVTLKKITWKDTNTKTVTITAKPADAGKFSTTSRVSTWEGSYDKAISFSVTAQIKFNFIEITYETAGAMKTTPTLAWSDAEAKVTFGDNSTYVFPTLDFTPAEAENLIYYTSSDPSVAEINAITGDITVKAVGTTTITATIDEDDTYYSASDTYELTVREAPNSMYYTIIFKNTTGGDGSNTPGATQQSLIEEGGEYVTIEGSKKIELSTIYLGKDGFGLKFSSSKNNGSITLPLSELGQIYAHTIEVQAAQYGSDNSSLKVNGSAAQTIEGTSLKTYTYTVSSDAPLTELKLEATKRLYVKQITVYRVPPMPAIDGMTEAGQNVDITPGETVLTVNVEKGCNLHVHEYLGEAANAPHRVSPAVKDIDLTSGAWRHLNPDGSASVEYPVPAGVKEIHFVAEHKNHVSTPLSLMINEDGTATGIEDIEAAEAEGDTEWYTLQGVRVSAPAAAGLYIRRTADTVEKVLVK